MKTLTGITLAVVAALVFSCGVSFAIEGEKLLAKKQIEAIPGRSVETVVKSERDRIGLINDKNYLGNNPPAVIILPPRNGFKDGGTVGIAPVNKYVKDPVRGIALPKDLLKDIKRPGQDIVKNISIDKGTRQKDKIDDGLIDGTKPPYAIIKPPRDEFRDDMPGRAPDNIAVKDPVKSITPPSDLINGPKRPYGIGSTIVGVFEQSEMPDGTDGLTKNQPDDKTPDIIKAPADPEPARPDPREARQRIPGIRSGAAIRGITKVVTKRIGDEESILE